MVVSVCDMKCITLHLALAFMMFARSQSRAADVGQREFDVTFNPSFTIPDKATSARAFVHSATIPYMCVFPNVVAGHQSLRVILPLKPAATAINHTVAGGVREITITNHPGWLVSYYHQCIEYIITRRESLAY